MYLEDVREIVERMEKDQQEFDSYIDSINKLDSSLCDFMLENKGFNITSMQNSFLLEKFLGHELHDLIGWYLYDRPLVKASDFGHYNIETNGVKYLVTDVNSLMDYIKVNYNFPVRSTGE